MNTKYLNKNDVKNPEGDKVSFIAQISNIIFHNPESGYTVLGVTKENGDYATIVGKMAKPIKGLTMKFDCSVKIDPKYGKQYSLKTYTEVTPTGNKGIHAFLTSSYIKGIGDALATRIINIFGTETLNIIEKSPEKLLKVKGISVGKLKTIVESYNTNKNILNIISKLGKYDVSENMAFKIYKRYGNSSISKLEENPYIVAYEISGVGFKKADRIAHFMGIKGNDPRRVKAIIIYVAIESAFKGGNCFITREQLLYFIKNNEEIIGISQPSENIVEDDVNKQLEELRSTGDTYGFSIKRVSETGLEMVTMPNFNLKSDAIYEKSIYDAEFETGAIIKKFSDISNRGIESKTAKKYLESNIKPSNKLTPQQQQGVVNGLTKPISILTGGPGTGKTHTVRDIIKISNELGINVLLLAPTGKAAKRLTQLTGMEASTIHRAIGFVPDTENARKIVDLGRYDIIIVDESSMIDIKLAHTLMKGLKLNQHIVFIGDVNQLPSVGPGMFLQSMIDSKVVPCVNLTKIFRQKEGSGIIDVAYKINLGEMPNFEYEDCFFDSIKDVQSIVGRIKSLIYEFGDNFQIIAPMYKGIIGVNNLNYIAQQIVNPNGKEFIVGGMGLERRFRIGDRVMFVDKNDYEKGVVNGDEGVIKLYNEVDDVFIVKFGNKLVEFNKFEMDNVVLSYAISIHKSQGSEFENVIMPIHSSQFIMLNRKLIYTAVTRASKTMHFIGEKKALAIGIKSNKTQKRNSLLKEIISM